MSLPSLPRRLRLGLLAALVAPWLFGAGPDYAGCGAGPEVAPTGTPLPTGELECAVDADCPESCADVRCVAGECLEVSPMIDADGDGVAPPPCGGDCDDERASVAPGEPERCDGLDNDCDGLIDDGALPTDTELLLNFGDRTSIVLPFGDRFLMTLTTPGAIFGVPLTIGGEASTPLELLRLTSGAAFTRVAGARADDGRLLVVAQVDDRALVYLVVVPDGDGLEVVAGPANVPHDLGNLRAVEVIPYDGAWALGIDGDLEEVSELGEVSARLVWTDLDAEPLVRIQEMAPLDPFDPFESFGLATDGTHVVLSDAAEGVHFYLPSGLEVMGFSVPGIRRARRPLASWAGSVIAVLDSPAEFELGLAHIDSVTGVGWIGPNSLATPSQALHSTSTTLYLTAVGDGVGARVHEVDPLTFNPRRRELRLRDPADVPLESLSVAEGDRGTVIGGGTRTPGGALQIYGACGMP